MDAERWIEGFAVRIACMSLLLAHIDVIVQAARSSTGRSPKAKRRRATPTSSHILECHASSGSISSTMDSRTASRISSTSGMLPALLISDLTIPSGTSHQPSCNSPYDYTVLLAEGTRISYYKVRLSMLKGSRTGLWRRFWRRSLLCNIICRRVRSLYIVSRLDLSHACSVSNCTGCLTMTALDCPTASLRQNPLRKQGRLPHAPNLIRTGFTVQTAERHQLQERTGDHACRP